MSEKPKQRLLSLDVLRGFDMLFIAGGGTFLTLLHGKTDMPWVDAIANQLEHVPWNGFVFYDFIFPLFLFMTGVSLSFSLSRGVSKGIPKKKLYRKVFIRMVVLILLGILYKNSPFPYFEPSKIRLGSVLGRIGIAGFVAALLYLNFSLVKRVYWIAGILLIYYAAMFLVPVPGYGAGDLSFEGNLVGWFDRTFLPGRLHQVTYDELGILTTFPAVCIAIFGSLAGDILRNKSTENKKTLTLVGIGLICVVIGLIWNLHFPINKRLWSSSFIVLTSGLGFLILALFYWIIDVKGYQKWTFFFKVIGLNSLVIYFAFRFIRFSYTSEQLFGGLYAPLPEQWHEVINALGGVVLIWLLLYILYKKKIFVKV
ncbi:DUF5009 domain-containing protein [Aurantibacter crassamenti]|uniref:acyltransferase family protein n=1 Tax=Aurantibacter crassamenti TaxID=1837375 RepID=UPI001939FBD6|nr:DUF5009 domain-containing protein [Aurantibacter crassamenti]MBM1104552.1 DUF5009 domain-containing protein [Aurantibacter crassamenti]